MTKEKKTVEIIVKVMLDSDTKEFIRDTLIEIENQIYSMGEYIDSKEKEESTDELDIGNEVYDEICELYCEDDEDEADVEFEDLGDYIPVTNDLDNLNKVLSCLGIPNVVFDGIGYCYNGNYYKINDVGLGKMALNITPVDKKDLDEICIKLLENQI